MQRRLGFTGIRNSLIPVTANFRSVISSSLSTIVEKARNLPKRVLMTKGVASALRHKLKLLGLSLTDFDPSQTYGSLLGKRVIVNG